MSPHRSQSAGARLFTHPSKQCSTQVDAGEVLLVIGVLPTTNRDLLVAVDSCCKAMFLFQLMVCVRVCVCACVRVCVRVRVRACVIVCTFLCSLLSVHLCRCN